MPARDPGFDQFVLGWSPRLLRTAYLLTGDRGAAEDLLQDVLERTYVAWPRVEDAGAYARRALLHAATSRWRRRRRRPEVPLAEWHESPAPGAPDAAEAAADRQVVLDALAQLPARQRAVLVLRYLDDLSEAETAAALGCSVGTVKSQSSRALVRLRVTFGEQPEPLASGRT